MWYLFLRLLLAPCDGPPIEVTGDLSSQPFVRVAVYCRLSRSRRRKASLDQVFSELRTAGKYFAREVDSWTIFVLIIGR